MAERQTRWFQVPVLRDVWVQIPSSAPKNTAEKDTFSAVFFYPSHRLGISSRRSRGYHQGRRAALVSHQPLWGWIFQRLDDIQHFVLVIYRNKLRMIYKAYALIYSRMCDIYSQQRSKLNFWFDLDFCFFFCIV